MYNRVNAFLCGICVGPRKYRALTLAASSHAHAETAAAHTLPTAQHSTSTPTAATRRSSAFCALGRGSAPSLLNSKPAQPRPAPLGYYSQESARRPSPASPACQSAPTRSQAARARPRRTAYPRCCSSRTKPHAYLQRALRWHADSSYACSS